MFFSRKYKFQSGLPAAEITNRLIGRHTTVHGLDFEVVTTDRGVRIVPHAEEVEDIKTLPVTRIDLQENGAGNTSVTLFAHMRRIDQGGPLLVLLFAVFMVLTGGLGYLLAGPDYAIYALPLLAVGVLIFIIMWVRLESGYFDYIRKIRNFVKAQLQK